MIILNVTSLTSPLDIGAFLSGQNYDLGQVGNNEIKVIANSTGGAISVILPPTSINPEQNMTVLVADESGTAGTHNITISGGNIDGATTNVISTNYAAVKLEILTSGDWVVV